MGLGEKLIEMKNISELMIDLAYSSLIYDNREIAEEVKYLEEKIDESYNQIIDESIRQAVEEKKPETAGIIIRLATSIEAISDSAAQIGDVVLRNIKPHPIIRESIKESDITIVLGVVKNSSILANRTLGELNLASETGMWVIAIKRGGKWIFGPTENTRILPEDRLIAKGPIEGVEHFKRLCVGIDKKL